MARAKTYRGYDLKETARLYNDFDYKPRENETENEFNDEE